MVTVILILNILFWFVITIDGIIGLKSIKKLEDVKICEDGQLVSIIIAARNEEKTIEQSILTQFNQSYPNIEWIAVNDRSTDQTGQRLENIKKKHQNLKVIHITELPEGWLGKNHALYVGSKHANGDYFLFTDADVLYERDVIGKAMSFIQTENIDHLTIAPNLTAKSFWLKTFVAFFLFGFAFFKRPWQANMDHSKIGTGIGAFNLISRQAYEAIGTHQAISLRPDDDLQLGFQIKRHGLKQRIVTGITLLTVNWYSSLREALIGLEKNTFAGLHYQIPMIFLAIVGTFLSTVFPFITLFTTSGWNFMFSAIIICMLGFLYTITIKKMTAFSPFLFFVFPITSLLFIYSIIRASILTFLRGGIIWRGTKYSLKELRKMQKL